jgi:NAD(P)-dependent dehydrogenase (short-subunit alcohol dehydrogenase family)
VQRSPEPEPAAAALNARGASAMLRAGLLAGVGVLLAGQEVPRAGGEALADAVAESCAALGATLASCMAPAGASPELQEGASERAVATALREIGRIDVLVIDAASSFEPGVLGERLQSAWALTRAVFNLALLPAREGGRLIYLAPRDGAGERSRAASAGLENLSRTLSIEWARHGVTAVTIAPGRLTEPGEVAALAAYLASPAGAYFSGCLLDLRGPGRTGAWLGN